MQHKNREAWHAAGQASRQPLRSGASKMKLAMRTAQRYHDHIILQHRSPLAAMIGDDPALIKSDWYSSTTMSLWHSFTRTVPSYMCDRASQYHRRSAAGTAARPSGPPLRRCSVLGNPRGGVGSVLVGMPFITPLGSLCLFHSVDGSMGVAPLPSSCLLGPRATNFPAPLPRSKYHPALRHNDNQRRRQERREVHCPTNPEKASNAPPLRTAHTHTPVCP